MKAFFHNIVMACNIRNLIAPVAVLVFLSTFSSLARASEAVVTDVRVGEHAGATRLVFDFDREVKFNIFALSNPHRVVIDLPEVGWRLPTKPLPVNIGVLVKLRYGLFKPGVSRVVLDVNSAPSVLRSFLLDSNGTGSYRLVVDLGTVNAGTVVKDQVQQEKVAFTPPPKKPKMVPEIPGKRVVVIDPGHGGVDPGTISANGYYEKHITLAMARELKLQLERTGRFKVKLTRSRDIFIKLRDRVEFAREAGADLFLSIHADAIKNRKTRGLSVYTLSEKASDREAEALAEQENKADMIAGVHVTENTPEITGILIDLTRRETMNQSARFATDMVNHLRRETRVLRNTHRFAGFAVLKAPDVPSILIELGFLSNKADEKELMSKAYRAKLASGMVRAITGYFSDIEEAFRK